MNGQEQMHGHHTAGQDFNGASVGAAYNTDPYAAARTPQGYPFPQVQYVPMYFAPEPEKQSVAEKVRHNAIPATLIGLGLAWLANDYRNSMNHGSYRHIDRDLQTGNTTDLGHDQGSGASVVQQTTARLNEKSQKLKAKANEVGQRLSQSATEASERARLMRQQAAARFQETAEQARLRLQQTAGEARVRMNELGQRTQVQIHETRQRIGRTHNEQPFLVALLGIAVGAAVAAALPNTRRENEVLGETRDDLMNRARDAAREQAEIVKQSAQRVATVAKEEMQVVADVAKDEAQHAKDRASDSAQNTMSGGNQV